MEKMKFQVVDINSLEFDERNARKHDKKNLEAIMGSLEEFGQQKPIVVDADNTVIAGNGTLYAARELGWGKITVARTKLTGDKAKAFALADNKTAELAEWDFDILGAQLSELADAGFNIEGIGFSKKDLGFDSKTGNTDPDDVPSIPKNAHQVAKGDIWQLGSHRIICADSTNPLALKALMGDEQADLLVTDPPYNVAYVGKTKEALTIDNDQMSNAKFREFLAKAMTAADSVMKPGATFYIWHADSEGYNFRGACLDIDWQVRQCLIWNKNTMVMGRQDYHWKHEPCLYGWKPGAAHNWYSDRKQVTVMEFDRPSRSSEHPCMKPVDLLEYQIKNSSTAGDIVMDTFLGSGSTLIASEKMGRQCRGVELDPHYCSVIIERWQNFTGEKGKRLNGKKKKKTVRRSRK